MTQQQPDKVFSAAAESLNGRVWSRIEKNDVKSAIADCQRLNREYPAYAPGWHSASQIALKMNKLPMALAAIDKAVRLEPDNVAWLLQKGLCLGRLGQAKELGSLVSQISGQPMKTAYHCSTLAMLLTQLGRREQAVGYYEQASKLQPEEAKHYYNAACLQRSLGDVAAAERNFDKTLSLNPGDYEAYKIRSELRTQTPGGNHIEALEQLVQAGIDDPRGEVQILYALAKELEDLGQFEHSFHYLKTGADKRRSYMKYDVERDLDTMRAIRERFSADVFESPSDGSASSEPIFILGMPRTGTTLVERILGSHSAVFAAGELTNFAVQMMRLVRHGHAGAPPARDELVELTTKLDFRELGDAYVESTRPFTGHTPRFIDKLPLNYLYVGLIHLALPRAKIVSLDRHPLDTCYAIYKQLFVDAYPFSYDLSELGRYYGAYRTLMEHWRTVLPGVVYTVSYESLVANIEPEARALTAFCELDWEPQCLKFHENPEASTTASTVQVRQPVYRSSVGKWRRYREELQPLIDVLEKNGVPLKL